MNLENLNVVELGAQEETSLNGGSEIDGYDCWCEQGDNAGQELVNFTAGLTSLVTGAVGYSVASGVAGLISWLNY